MLPEAIRPWTETAGAPVANGGDGNAQIAGELADVEQRF